MVCLVFWKKLCTFRIKLTLNLTLRTKGRVTSSVKETAWSKFSVALFRVSVRIITLFFPSLLFLPIVHLIFIVSSILSTVRFFFCAKFVLSFLDYTYLWNLTKSVINSIRAVIYKHFSLRNCSLCCMLHVTYCTW